ncbi:ABC transporter permease subunit [Aquabacter sp. L1I39]|uniref:ABC transporter permease n=1 Tax=Aquabacter sp. L1I39 TaxID=2820278 RepID=UPI001ADA3F83|nr:ABC transporter permease subunit [Aquabacter sp. L1I39]QTL05243.1 ABC transporter permease subunit [Aquabacter sp. L1I39]
MAEPLSSQTPALGRVPPIRPEFERDLPAVEEPGEIVHPLSLFERLANVDGVRRGLILIALMALWQAYAVMLGNPLMFPTLTDTLAALVEGVREGTLLLRILSSLHVLLIGYAIGIALAAVLTSLAVSFRLGADLLATLTAMFNPLPAIALLPLALLWFGLGTASLVFVIVHSVTWAVALNTQTGFHSVPDTQRLAGQNYGLKGLRYVGLILIPAAFPSILAGLKIGWAFAWRTLIAAELVFGASSRSGGLGWYLFEKRNQLETPAVFAGLTCVIIIGLVVEGLVFRTLEARTVQRWGMSRAG